MFSAEKFEAKIKGLKLRVEGSLKLCDLTLELPIGGDLAGGMPKGTETFKALEEGDYKRVVIESDAVEFEASMSCPPRDAGPKAKPEVYAAKNVKVLEIALSRKESTEGGAATVVARPQLSFRLTDDLMLFVARHFADSDLSFRLAKQQMDLPGTESPAKKKGNGKGAAPGAEA